MTVSFTLRCDGFTVGQFLIERFLVMSVNIRRLPGSLCR